VIIAVALCATFLALNCVVGAQQQERIYRIGYLAVSTVHEDFRQGLRELGYSEYGAVHVTPYTLPFRGGPGAGENFSHRLPSSSNGIGPSEIAFREGLRELGYILKSPGT
jgi:hypothetical protein